MIVMRVSKITVLIMSKYQENHLTSVKLRSTISCLSVNSDSFTYILCDTGIFIPLTPTRCKGNPIKNSPTSYLNDKNNKYELIARERWTYCGSGTKSASIRLSCVCSRSFST